jgi:hypothetical protein
MNCRLVADFAYLPSNSITNLSDSIPRQGSESLLAHDKEVEIALLSLLPLGEAAEEDDCTFHPVSDFVRNLLH